MKSFKLFANLNNFVLKNKYALAPRPGYKNATTTAKSFASTTVKERHHTNSRCLIHKLEQPERRNLSAFQQPTAGAQSQIANAIEYHKSTGTIEVGWSQGDSDHFPILWLRDNCQCPKCYNESSMSRRLLMRDLDPDTSPSQVKVRIVERQLPKKRLILREKEIRL